MTDIVKRLRDYAEGPFNPTAEVLIEAADTIERLRADIHSCHPNCTRAGCVNERLRAALLVWEKLSEDNERLRAALRRLLDMDVAYGRGPKVEEAVEAARAALGE